MPAPRPLISGETRLGYTEVGLVLRRRVPRLVKEHDRGTKKRDLVALSAEPIDREPHGRSSAVDPSAVWVLIEENFQEPAPAPAIHQRALRPRSSKEARSFRQACACTSTRDRERLSCRAT